MLSVLYSKCLIYYTCFKKKNTTTIVVINAAIVVYNIAIVADGLL